MNLFKRKPKVSLVEHKYAVDAYNRLLVERDAIAAERDSYCEDALKYRASIAHLHAANARRKAQARDKQQAEVG